MLMAVSRDQCVVESSAVILFGVFFKLWIAWFWPSESPKPALCCTLEVPYLIEDKDLKINAADDKKTDIYKSNNFL